MTKTRRRSSSTVDWLFRGPGGTFSVYGVSNATLLVLVIVLFAAIQMLRVWVRM